MAIVAMRSTWAIGSPFEAIIAAVCAKPPILLHPELTKMTARRMRPTSAAASATAGLRAEGRGRFVGLFASVFMVVSWSWQVEKKDVGRARFADTDLGFALCLESIAGGEEFAIHARLAANDMDVRASAGADGVHDGRVGRIDVRGKTARRLVEANRSPAAVGGCDEAPLAAPGSVVATLFLVARSDAALARLDPDLEVMDRLALGGVVFRLRDAGAGPHALHIARPDHRAIAHRITVRELAFEHVAQDFHVAVAVRAEALARLHAVLVDHAQRSAAHVRGIVVVRE